jgi:hypothetical protein
VTLCHIPRGNPDKARTITTNNPNATRAHLKHGDTIGPCSAAVGQSSSKGPAGSFGTLTGGCSLRSGASNGAPLSPILLCLCALLLRERRRKRAPATSR